MGSMNAPGWLIVALAGGSPESLWDLLCEFGRMTETDGPTVHALPQGLPRWCVHPDSSPDVEFRSDDLHEALFNAAAWKASVMPADLIWRRD